MFQRILPGTVFIPTSAVVIILAVVLPGSCSDIWRDDYLRVPSEYPTIQAAIDAAIAGDTVRVYPGIFTGAGNRDIDFRGKPITVKSAYGPDYTVIDCEYTGRGFQFTSYEDHSSWLDGFTICNCTPASSGAGIVCVDASPVISNCFISGNYTFNSGGGLACIRSLPIITNCMIEGNTALNNGAGIYCHASSPQIIECSIRANSSGYRGGGIFCLDSSPIIRKCLVTENSSSDRGGGIFCLESSSFLTDCEISGNNVDGRGGGISYYDSSPTITKCSIAENEAVYDGGGIHFYYSYPEISHCSIKANTAARRGGGIFFNDSRRNLINCVISMNKAGDDGGGIYCRYSQPVLKNCKISENIALGDGGGIYCHRSHSVIKHCTISANAGGRFGGGIYSFESPAPTIKNSILWGDSPSEIAFFYTEVTVTYTNVEGGWPGIGNIDLDPLFIDPERDDYHLHPVSPCIDAGIDCGVYEDLDGDPRPMRDGFDLGADEAGIIEDPIISISPKSFARTGECGGYIENDTLIISNIGADELIYEVIDGSEAWLSLTGALKGAIQPEDSTLVFLNYDISMLDVGIYDDTVSILSNDPWSPSKLIPVRIEILCGGIIRVPGDCSTIKDAIDLAFDGATVLVADGTYTGSGNKNIDFNAKKITVKSENGAFHTVIDCENEGRSFYFHSDEGSYSRLEGFTLINGNPVDGYGGAIYFSNSSPTIVDCIISGNTIGDSDGGGIFCANSNPHIANCAIYYNSTNQNGGGLFCTESNPQISTSTISGNSAQLNGGGIYCVDSYPHFSNCSFSQNIAQKKGGGLYCRNSSPILNNCTITSNAAVLGGGGIRCYANSYPFISNCILWADSPQEILIDFNDPVVTYSNIEGGWEGEGNIDTDPRLVSYEGIDYLLHPWSPCIDTGDPAVEDALYDWHPLVPDWYVNGVRSDMGAYGGPGNIDWFKD